MYESTLTPPDVGAADASSAILMPTKRIKTEATAHYCALELVFGMGEDG